MWNRKARTRILGRQKQARRKATPLIETVEERVLLSGQGFLQGTAYLGSPGTLGRSGTNFDPSVTAGTQQSVLISLYTGTNTTVAPLLDNHHGRKRALQLLEPLTRSVHDRRDPSEQLPEQRHTGPFPAPIRDRDDEFHRGSGGRDVEPLHDLQLQRRDCTQCGRHHLHAEWDLRRPHRVWAASHDRERDRVRCLLRESEYVPVDLGTRHLHDDRSSDPARAEHDQQSRSDQLPRRAVHQLPLQSVPEAPLQHVHRVPQSLYARTGLSGPGSASRNLEAHLRQRAEHADIDRLDELFVQYLLEYREIHSYQPGEPCGHRQRS